MTDACGRCLTNASCATSPLVRPSTHGPGTSRSATSPTRCGSRALQAITSAGALSFTGRNVAATSRADGTVVFPVFIPASDHRCPGGAQKRWPAGALFRFAPPRPPLGGGRNHGGGVHEEHRALDRRGPTCARLDSEI